MAATQAEPQQNEVNRDLVQQEQPPSLGNTGLQNGTDKSVNRSISASDVAGSKAKNSLPVEMSQYRQETGAGPPLHNSDQNTNSSEDVSGKINNSDKPYSHNSEQSGPGEQNFGKGPSDNGNQNIQGYGLPFPQRPGYHHTDQNNPMQMGSDNSLHHQNNSYGQFNPQNMRHGYPGAKPVSGPPRPPSAGSSMNSPGGNFPHAQQRILSGQSISQPTGPTPTLNQLLQSSNPVQRYQNSYGDYGMPKSGEQPQGSMPYNQNWPPPRGMAPYGPQQGAPGYRNQPSSVPVQGNRGQVPSYLGSSGGGGSPGYPPPASPGTPASGSQYPPGGGQYPPYPQRYPTPPSAAPGNGPPGPGGPGSGPGSNSSPNTPVRQPYSPHQLGSPYAPPGSGPGPQQHQQAQQNQPQPTPNQQQPQPPSQPNQSGGGPNPGQPVSQNQQQSQHQSQSSVGQSSNGNYNQEGRWPPPPSPNTGPQPSPQPSSQPQPSPQAPPQSPQHQSFPSRPQQPSTPNAHAPDTGDLTGGNSNDSCSGPAPGTPNSQGMRPTPSPTGSTGSRSMSPAVGQQNIPMPPRPSSSQSDGGGSNAPGGGGGSARISHSPIAASQGYPQQLAPPSLMPNYKLSVPTPGGPGMVPQQMPPSPYSNAGQQQYPQQGNYSPRPQGQLQYGPNQSYGSQNPQANNIHGGPGSQYQNRPLLNHVPPHSQFGGYQGWGGPGMNQGPPPGSIMGGPGPGGPGNNHIGSGPGKGGPQQTPPPQNQQTPSQPSNQSPGPRSHTPPHYHKPHLQHKGYGNANAGSGGMPPSPGNYGNNSGPPHHHPMGPPPHHPGMGPPPPSMGPPPNSHHDGPMPPPSSTPNSHPVMPHSEISTELHDNGITTTATGTVMTSVSGSQTGGVTSVVTTGPDGTPMDEASQQSTLSNASAASGEDPSCTPGKSRNSGNKDLMYHHPSTPQSTAPSPGAASMNSMHDDYPPDSSPTWPRTPASPVYNSHVQPDIYRTKKHDSLGKLYEMDDSVDRKIWLDKLLQFMEDRGTPISACPTISKNPLDLFRLYLFVKERGGFMEVCKVQCSSMVTKNKIWKDIAGLLGIGASSSAAYTLRKHYTKNLLPFECQFDRGGIDPQPIINQVEASTKKKGNKNNPVPSPGSSNSQDSFPGPGSGNASMDGYGYGYPPDYNNQRPPTQSNQGMPGGYQNQGGYSQYPDQYNQQYPAPGPGANYPPNRPMYPPTPYGPDADRGYNQGNNANQPNTGQPGGQDPYRGYMAPGGQPGYPPRAGYPPQPPPGPTVAAQNQGTPPGQQPDYYRPEQVYPGQTGGPGPAGGYPGTPQSKTMPPPPTNQPRRHPDFAKDQQPGPYPPYNPQRPSLYPGWSNTNNNQYVRSPSQFGNQGANAGQWSGGPPRPGGPPSSQQPPPVNPQWDQHQHRYPPSSQPPFQSPQQWNIGSMPNSVGPQTALRSPMANRPNFRPEGKPFNQMGPNVPSMKQGQGVSVQQTGVKREMVFPIDSVEAVTPVLYKRRRLTKQDVAPVDAWRLMMSLRSGLLAETCWALDVLNILLFDDASISYFGLQHLPGLLDTLLEHFRRALNDMLEPNEDPVQRLWYERTAHEDKDVDLGSVENPPDPKDRITLMKGPNHTLKTRRGLPVSIVPAPDDIFVLDKKRTWDREEVLDESSCDEEVTKYIVPCFRGDFGVVPFVRVLEDKEPKENYKESESDDRTKSVDSDSLCTKTTIKDEKIDVKKEENEEAVDVNKDEESITDPLADRIKDPAGILKRRRISDYEDECYSRDEASLFLVTDSQDAIARRCICLSNIFRNLTFVPGNELEFAKNMQFLGLLGKLLLMHHEHPLRSQKQRNYEREEDADFGDCCSSLQGDGEWWWEYLHHLRENALVCAANIAGYIDLEPCPEEISRPLLDGLLHWAVCPAAQGQDPLPTVGPSSMLSPQRLALEALTKLCVTDANVDLVIATPPFSRLERLCAVLTRLLCRSEEQVLREFAVNLLHYLAAADSAMARTIALQSPCVSLLVAFIEQAEASALGVANQHGINALRENPDCMGTSLDMLRRTARTLLHLSKHPENRPLFLEQEQRLLALVMSQILDQQVAALISRVLFHCSRPSLT